MKLFIVLIILSFISCKEKIDKVGTFRATGNVPFVQLVFTAENIDYQLSREVQLKYDKQQNRRVRIVGEVSLNEVKGDDGSIRMKIYKLEPDSVFILE